jgi:hypothetical protein
MPRRTLAALALVCLCLLAGCSGLLGSAPATPTDGATTTAPTTDEGPTGPLYEPPLDPATVLDRHEAALADAGTFTAVQESTYRAVEGGDFRQQTNVTAAVDLDRDRTLVVQNVTLQGESVAYGNATVGYERLSVGDDARYRVAPDNVTAPGFYARPPVDRYLRGLNYTLDGTETRDGTTVSTYVVDGTDQLTPGEHGLTVIASENVTDVSSRLSIREDGRIEAFEYRARGTANGATVEYTIALTWERVGSTPVSAPAWVSDARNATGR